MAELTLKDRLRKSAGGGGGAPRSGLADALTKPLRRLIEPVEALDHLLIVPQDLRTADPSFWDELEQGQFGLAGAVAMLHGRSPFAIEPPSAAWT